MRGIVKTDRLIVFGGGFPIMADGRIIGGIGVSGGHYTHDMEVAAHRGEPHNHTRHYTNLLFCGISSYGTVTLCSVSTYRVPGMERQIDIQISISFFA